MWTLYTFLMTVLIIFYSPPLVIASWKLWVTNVYYTVVIWRNVDGLIPMSTSLINTNINTQWSTKPIWIMVRRGAGMRPRFTSPITIKTLSIIVKGRVAGLLIHNSTTYIINTATTSFIVMKTPVHSNKQQINSSIYYGHMCYGRKNGQSGTYIHLSNHHQQFLRDFKRKSGWSVETYIHIYHHQHLYHPSCYHHHELYLASSHHCWHSHQPSHLHNHCIVIYHIHEDYCQQENNKLINSTIYHGQMGCGSKSV